MKKKIDLIDQIKNMIRQLKHWLKNILKIRKIFVLVCFLLVNCGAPPQIGKESYFSQLTLYEDHLYFGAGYCLYQLEIETQQLRKIKCTENDLFQKPEIDQDRAYVQIVTNPQRSKGLLALRLSDGTVEWRRDENDSKPYSNFMQYDLFVIDNKVIMGQYTDSGVARLYALDQKSGSEIWSSQPHDIHVPYYSSALFLDENLIWYAISLYPRKDSGPNDGKLIATNIRTGKTDQIIDLGIDARFDRLNYIDTDWIVGWDERGYLFVVDRILNNQVMWARKNLRGALEAQQIIVRNGRLILPLDKAYSIDVSTQQEMWVFDPKANPIKIEEFNEVMLLMLPDPEPKINALYALNPESGEMMWKHQYQIPDSVQLRYLVHEDVVFVAHGDTVRALNLYTGVELWKVDIDSEVLVYDQD